MEARSIDAIFAKKQEKEIELDKLKVELDTKRSVIDSMVSNMEGDLLEHYRALSEEKEKIKKVI